MESILAYHEPARGLEEDMRDSFSVGEGVERAGRVVGSAWRCSKTRCRLYAVERMSCVVDFHSTEGLIEYMQVCVRGQYDGDHTVNE
jgi:hypothetical protein